MVRGWSTLVVVVLPKLPLLLPTTTSTTSTTTTNCHMKKKLTDEYVNPSCELAKAKADESDLMTKTEAQINISLARERSLHPPCACSERQRVGNAQSK